MEENKYVNISFIKRTSQTVRKEGKEGMKKHGTNKNAEQMDMWRQKDRETKINAEQWDGPTEESAHESQNARVGRGDQYAQEGRSAACRLAQQPWLHASQTHSWSGQAVN